MLFYVFAYKNTNKYRIPLTFSQKKQKLNEKQTILNKKASSPTMQYGNLPFITPTARGGGDRCLHNHTSATSEAADSASELAVHTDPSD